MRVRGFVAYMRREARGSRSRVVFFLGCLAIGVAAIVAVAGLAAGLDQGIREQGRELLAADLAISGLRPLPAAVTALLGDWPEAEILEVKEMVTVVAAPGAGGEPGRSRVVELKVVGSGYPFYGGLDLEPPSALGTVLSEQTVVAAPELAVGLGLGIGDNLLVGGEAFEIVALVGREPDRLGSAFTLGPRLFLAPAGLERAGLEQFGSRIVRRTLVKLSDGSGERLEAELKQMLPPDRGFRVETHAEAQPALRAGIRRAEQFLGLAALLSLVLGGIGVSQTLRSWLAGRMDTIAVLRCIGFRPREVVLLYMGQSVVLGLTGSLIGAALGTLIVAVLPLALAGLLPAVDTPVVQPAAVLRGVALGVGVALLFAVGPLLDAGRIPPLRVLRRDVEPPRPRAWQRILLAAVVAGGVFAVAAVQAASAARGAQFTLGLALAAVLLASIARLGTWLLSRYPARRGRPWVRNGLRALSRPGAATLSAVTALGLGVLAVVGVGLVERTLTRELVASIPESSPTAFLIDIQPQQWPRVRQLLADRGSTAIDSVPVVTGRLAAIDGRRVGDLVAAAEGRGGRWALTREQRLTYRRDLPAGNRIVAGSLWRRDGIDEVSVEEEFARDLGVDVGSVLRFDVQGTELDLTVSSIRAVDWRTFGINFFLMAEPEALAAAPQVRLAAARLPADREQEVQDALAASFPNVTLIRTREVLEKVGRVLGRLAEGVKLLGGFTVFTGMIILAGAVSASAVQRGREVALLKTLGATRAQVVGQLVLEHALLGLVAGVVGAVGGGVLASVVVTRGFELAFTWRPVSLAIVVVATAALAAATGIAACWGALDRRPMEVLRAE